MRLPEAELIKESKITHALKKICCRGMDLPKILVDATTSDGDEGKNNDTHLFFKSCVGQ
jgi:hypothetical protein